MANNTNNQQYTGVDGGLTVFTAGRDFCLMEMVRECCQQYVDHKCTLDEFTRMYEAVLISAAEHEIMQQP